ncbi:MAG: GNAT family N-acetyltransferase [Bacteroidota bacterium]
MQQIIQASRKDKSRVLDILVEAFWDDPHINWFSGKGKQRGRRIRTLMSFAFEEALSRGDVYLSHNREAVAVWRNSPNTPFNWHIAWEYVKFTFRYGIRKIQAISALEKAIHARYPKEEAFYYLFILGTSKQGRGQGLSSQLMNVMLEEADAKGIDTYLETSNPVNLPIYARKGFAVYDTLEVEGKHPIKVNFLRRAFSDQADRKQDEISATAVVGA